MSAPATPSHAIRRTAERQHGNVTITQLRASGLSDREVRRRVEKGALKRRHTGVYAVGHVPQTRESRWMAGVLALGSGAVLSHRAAGALWGIVDGAVETEVLVSSGTGRAKRDGIVVHRAPLRPEDVVRRRGIPVTSLLRTLLDLAAVQPPDQLERSFEQAQVHHHLAPELLAVEVLCRRRYRGSRRLRHLLAEAVDPAKVRSVLELRFLKMCGAQGIRRPLVNERVGPWMPDFLWTTEHVVVETDGRRFHHTAAQRRKDREKDAYLRAQGFTVIRLTWTEVVEQPDATGARVRAALAADAATDATSVS